MAAVELMPLIMLKAESLYMCLWSSFYFLVSSIVGVRQLLLECFLRLTIQLMWLCSLSILAELKKKNKMDKYVISSSFCSKCDERRNSIKQSDLFCIWCLSAMLVCQLIFWELRFLLRSLSFFGWILKNPVICLLRSLCPFFVFVSVIICFYSRQVDEVQIVIVEFKMIVHCERDAVDEKCYKVLFKFSKTSVNNFEPLLRVSLIGGLTIQCLAN